MWKELQELEGRLRSVLDCDDLEDEEFAEKMGELAWQLDQAILQLKKLK